MLLFIKFAVIGLGAAFLLLVIAKIILAAVLQRKPDYYLDQYDQFDQRKQGGDENA